MSNWVIRGLTAGIKTTRYPAGPEATPGASPGRPVGGAYPESDIHKLVACCPTAAINRLGEGRVQVDHRLCIHCGRCKSDLDPPLAWDYGHEWAALTGDTSAGPMETAFERSVNILVVDTGDCGACLNEVKQLNNPYYNIHRLGFFITPTPRMADVLIVVGPLTDHMRLPLTKAYEAMPTPKRVIAVGACALSGGVFAPSFACGTGPSAILPIDVAVPGNPPPPLAIVHGLLVAVGRASPASPVSPDADALEGTGK